MNVPQSIMTCKSINENETHELMAEFDISSYGHLDEYLFQNVLNCHT